MAEKRKYIDYVIRLQRLWASTNREGERDTSDLARILAAFPHNRNASFRSLQHLSEPNLVTLKTEAHSSFETTERTYANDPTRCLNSEVYKSFFNPLTPNGH